MASSGPLKSGIAVLAARAGVPDRARRALPGPSRHGPGRASSLAHTRSACTTARRSSRKRSPGWTRRTWHRPDPRPDRSVHRGWHVRGWRATWNGEDCGSGSLNPCRCPDGRVTASRLMEASRGTSASPLLVSRQGVLYDHRRGFSSRSGLISWASLHGTQERWSRIRAYSSSSRRGHLRRGVHPGCRRPRALGAAPAGDDRDGVGPFLLGLNTSTIRGQKLPIVQEIEIAAKAGYQGMEPWIDELRAIRRGRAVRSRTWASGSRRGHLASRAPSTSSSGPSMTRAAVRRRSRPPGKAWRSSGRSAASGWPLRPSARPNTPSNRCASPSATAPCWSSAIGWAWFPQAEVWGFSRDPRPARRGCPGRHRNRPSPGVHPARRLPPLQRRIAPGGHQASRAGRDSRLSRERLSRPSPARETHRRRPRLSRGRRRSLQVAPPRPPRQGASA